MEENTALHTVARRFCMAQHSGWAEKYLRLERAGKSRVNDSRISAGWHYAEEAFALFPRYRLDDEILAEVEALIPASCTSLAELSQALSDAGERGFAKLAIEFRGNSVAKCALRSELAAFAEHVANARGTDLNCVESLPYRRVLTPAESGRIWKLLTERWGVGEEHHWYPLNQASPPKDAIAFHAELWDARGGTSIFLGSLAGKAVERCYVLRELGPPDYEMESSAVEPHYDGSEAFITSDGEWLLYSSHESSITVAGWLADSFRRQWPDAEKIMYGGPFHTDDLKGTWQS